MRKIVKHIPNALTCANLACGMAACAAAFPAFKYSCETVACLICAAAVFDFFDGLAARLLKAYSPIGKDLDSLADLVSFGVAPAIMLLSFTSNLKDFDDGLLNSLYLVPAIPFLAIPVFSALRLAKFNIDDRQKTSFIGLPVPAHAILLSMLMAALPSLHDMPADWDFALSPAFVYIGLSAFATLTSCLLVSKIPMFSLKFTSLAWKGNRRRYILIAAAAAMTVAFGGAGVAAAIMLYIFMSVFISLFVR